MGEVQVKFCAWFNKSQERFMVLAGVFATMVKKVWFSLLVHARMALSLTEGRLVKNVLGGWIHSGHFGPIRADCLSTSHPGAGVGSQWSTQPSWWPAAAGVPNGVTIGQDTLYCESMHYTSLNYRFHILFDSLTTTTTLGSWYMDYNDSCTDWLHRGGSCCFSLAWYLLLNLAQDILWLGF